MERMRGIRNLLDRKPRVECSGSEQEGREGGREEGSTAGLSCPVLSSRMYVNHLLLGTKGEKEGKGGGRKCRVWDIKCGFFGRKEGGEVRPVVFIR